MAQKKDFKTRVTPGGFAGPCKNSMLQSRQSESRPNQRWD